MLRPAGHNPSSHEDRRIPLTTGLWRWVSPWLSRDELTRAVRFLTVGVLAIPLNTGILWALTEWGHLYYLLSSLIAIEISIVARFFVNHVWTFATLQDREPLLRRLLKFNLASVGGLALNIFGLFFFSRVIRLHYLLANICGIGLGTIWNYSISRAWIWRKATPPDEATAPVVENVPAAPVP